MPEVYTGPAGMWDVTQQRRRNLVLPEKINKLDAFETPFYAFTDFAIKGTSYTDDYRFNVQEKRPIADEVFVQAVEAGQNFGQGAANNEANITLSLTVNGAADNTMAYVNAMVYFPTKDFAAANPTNKTTGIRAIITSISAGAGGAYITVRALAETPGGVPASTLAAGDPVLFMSSAYTDGASAGIARYKQVETDYNFCQIAREPVEVTRRNYYAKLYGDRAYDLMVADCVRAFKRGKERSYLVGSRTELTAAGGALAVGGGPERTTSEGFLTWLERKSGGAAQPYLINRATALNVYTIDEFIIDMEQLTRYRSGEEKWGFVSRKVMAYFNQTNFFNNTQRWDIQQKPNSLGINVTTLFTPFGTLHLVLCPALHTGAATADDLDLSLIVVDPMGVEKKVHRGGEVQWLPIIREGGQRLEGSKELYSDDGLAFSLPENHGWVRWASET